ncbi:hypothetical protein [Paenibacillus spongiae]|uniref:Uncharacterized protein n=1 Tax=Paenibacillus spongiae TaxID=2909671 RepID=A0ABY5S139_9BACL|nr:hypothetical protein [Paenibacillus spongiae]UVI27571.1 hypothetical protein L1F29_19070 [Paenibacillus spongiae]
MKTIPLRPKSFALAALAALTFTLQAGPAAAAGTESAQPQGSFNQTAAVNSTSADKVINQYEALLKQGKLPKAFSYLNEHIDEVTKYQAMILVLHLENAVKKALPSMVDRIGKTSVQTQINKVYKIGDSFADVIKRTNDKSLKALLQEAADSGFKLETAEGFYFPVVRYAALQKFNPYVTDDIKAYMDIMTVESEKASVKDAGLMIGYQELVNRALSQERFVKQFPSSNRIAQVKQLFQSYKILTFYGVNNTPLFDYDTKVIQPNAKKGYGLILKWNDTKSSPYLTTLQKFMNLLADQNDKLTEEVEKFRKANVPIQ